MKNKRTQKIKQQTQNNERVSKSLGRVLQNRRTKSEEQEIIAKQVN